MKQHNKQSHSHRIAANKRAFSTVISTIILTSVLLIILIVATFVSTNMLTLQMNSTEFEQAKSNMLLLDDMVQDISLRAGSGGYLQFNERTGGIGLTQSTMTVTVNVTDNEGTKTIYNNSLTIFNFTYSGGSLTSAANVDLRGNESMGTLMNMSQSLGYLRVELDKGAKIKLDYDRMRVVQVGLIDGSTNLIEITFVRLVKGAMGGSGTVNVKLQNVQTITNATSIPSGNVTIDVIFGQYDPRYTANYTSSGDKTVILFTEVQIMVTKS